MLKQVALTFPVLLAVVVNADACPGDANCDSAVNVADLLNVLADWGTDGSANGGDVNCDSAVNVPDLLVVLSHWNVCQEFAPPVAVLYGDGNSIGSEILGYECGLFENPERYSLHLRLQELTDGNQLIFLAEQDVLLTDLTLLGGPIGCAQFAEVSWTTAPIQEGSLVEACNQVFEAVGGEPLGGRHCELLDPQNP